MSNSKTQHITKGNVITTNPVNEKHSVAKIIGERIKSLRKSQGMTQRDLAGKIGVCLQAVSFWEHGKRSPSIKRLCLLAKILNAPTDYLLGIIDATSVQEGIQVKVISVEGKALEVVSRLMNEKRIAENYVCILIGEKKELVEKVERFLTRISTGAVMLQATLNNYGCRLPDEDVKEIEAFLRHLVHFKV